MAEKQWKVKSFQELLLPELYTIMKKRIDIFVVEQSCAYEEADNKDQSCTHLYLEQSGDVIAYARLVPSGVSYSQASIGRVLVDKGHRGNGYARELLQKSIEIIRKEWGEKEIKIQAQTYLKEFYASFGFKVISDMYLDDGIPHLDMLLEVE